MTTVAKIRLAVGIVFVVAIAVVFSDNVLSTFGIAAPAWLTSAMIGADFVALACVLVLFALLYRPETRPLRREARRREGRTLGFYIWSIIALVGLSFVVLVVAGYLLDGTGYERFALFAPMVVGLGYMAWYARYARRNAERYDAEHDTFS